MNPRRLSTLVLSTLFVLSACGSAMSSADDGDPNAPDNDPGSPPANWSKLYTTDTPTWIGIYVQNNSSSATGSTLKLSYINKSGTYSCTINGATNAQTTGCTPSLTSTYTTTGEDKFYLAFADDADSSDGLRFSGVKVTLNGTTYSKDTFDLYDDADKDDLSCTSCNLAYDNCGSCWIDGDANGCVEAKIPMNNSPGTDPGSNTQCSRSL